MVHIARHIISKEKYHQMGEAGILPEKGVELINGEIIQMSPVGPIHTATVERIKDYLVLALQKKAMIRVQNPIGLLNDTEPEPDISIIKFRQDYYAESHPEPKDVLIFIEVAKSSLDYDRTVKLPLYAKAKIPEYWIMNLIDLQIEVYSQPKDDYYKTREILKKDDVVQVEQFDLKIPVEEMLFISA